MRVSARGFLGDLPVSILVDSDRPCSLVSSHFVLAHSLPRTILTENSVARVYLNPFLRVLADQDECRGYIRVRMDTTGPYDLVLGADWITQALPVVIDGSLARPARCLPCFVWASAHPPLHEASPSGRTQPVSGTPSYPRASTSVAHSDDLDSFAVCDSGFSNLSVAQLECRLDSHGVHYSPHVGAEALSSALVQHLASGGCLDGGESPACIIVRERCILPDDADAPDDRRLQHHAAFLAHVVPHIKGRPLQRLLTAMGVSFPSSASVGRLRSVARKYVESISKGKAQTLARHDAAAYAAEKNFEQSVRLAATETVARAWPQPVSSALKEKLLHLFRERTSADALRTFTCACCAQDTPYSDRHVVPLTELPLKILRCPVYAQTAGYDLPLPLAHLGPDLRDVMLDPAGLVDFNRQAQLCRSCKSSLARESLPDLALANGLYLGPSLPAELQLSPIEEAMVALCRAKSMIVHLKDEEARLTQRHTDSRHFQRAIRGNIIIHPQRPGKLLDVLPPSVEDIVSSVCVIFVGSSPPTREWLRDHAYPLAARPDRIRKMLYWLKAHNPLYAEVEINEERLNALPLDGVLPFSIELVDPSAAQDAATSRYDARDQLHESTEDGEVSGPNEINFQSVVITDVDGNAPQSDLRAAAVRHVKDKGGGFIQFPHDPTPVNEFCNPALIPMLYPTLFPLRRRRIGGTASTSPRVFQASLTQFVRSQ